MSSIVIPTKAEDTLIRFVEANLSEPYAVKRGRGRTHIPFVILAFKFELREFKSTEHTTFGKLTKSVNAIAMGYDQKLDDEGRALFEHAEHGVVARTGSIKAPTFLVVDTGESISFADADDEDKAAFVAELVPLAKAEGEIKEITGPHFKVTFGINYNVPENKRTAGDQLSLAPYAGFPMKANNWIGRDGEAKSGKDQVDWDQITGIESRASWALKNHEELGDEDLSFIVANIPFSSDSKARQASAGNTAIGQATQEAESNPFATTV